jgi:hypothetical protein
MKRKCEFQKRDGQRCGADAQSGKTLCVFHDPAKAAAGRSLLDAFIFQRDGLKSGRL